MLYVHTKSDKNLSSNCHGHAGKTSILPHLETFQENGKECVKAVYCHPAYLTDMQSASCEMPSWMELELESRLLGEISITSVRQMTPP